MSKLTPEDNVLAEKFFRQAIDLDPTFAGGYIGLVSVLADASTTFHTRSLQDTQASSETLARRAVVLDGANAEAHACLGATLFRRGDHDGARAEAELALAINPNLARGYAVLGMAQIHSGEAGKGLSSLHTCIRLDPRDPGIAARFNHVMVALYFLRDYEAVIETAKRVIRSYPDFSPIYRWLAAALGQLGRADEAKEALAKAVAIAPTLFDIHRPPHAMGAAGRSRTFGRGPPESGTAKLRPLPGIRRPRALTYSKSFLRTTSGRLRRSRIFGQRDKLKANRSKGA